MAAPDTQSTLREICATEPQEYFHRYGTELAARNFSPRTIKNYLCVMKKFTSMITRSVEDTTPEHIKNYLFRNQ